jgi:hypothetical protein
LPNIEAYKLVYEIRDQLRETLSNLPDVQLVGLYNEAPTLDRGFDMEVTFRCKGQLVVLGVLIKTGLVHPKAALEAVEYLRSYSACAVMLAASSLSEATRAFLRDSKIGYWDCSGSLYLDLPQALYWIDRPPLPQPREGRELKNPYRGSSAQVLHSLLLEPQRPWKVTELAEEAGVSPYTSQQVLGYLEKQLWVRREGRGPHGVRYLDEPGKLLDDWAAHHSLRDYKHIRLHRLAKNLEVQREHLAAFLGSQDIPWALTLEHGAHAVASFVTRLPGVITVIVPEARHWVELAKSAGYREVGDGENLHLWLTGDQTPFLGRTLEGNLQIASPVQLYLDLFQWPRRGKEQAQHIRERILKF